MRSRLSSIKERTSAVLLQGREKWEGDEEADGEGSPSEAEEEKFDEGGDVVFASVLAPACPSPLADAGGGSWRSVGEKGLDGPEEADERDICNGDGEGDGDRAPPGAPLALTPGGAGVDGGDGIKVVLRGSGETEAEALGTSFLSSSGHEWVRLTRTIGARI